LKRDEIERVLVELASSTTRILRPVAALGHPEIQRYEIFHDRLADAILGWRARYQTDRAANLARRVTVQTGLRLALIALPSVLVLTFAYQLFRPPSINQFYADSPAVVAGGFTTLRWDVDRAAALTLDPGPSTIDRGTDSVVFSPNSS